MDNLRLPTPRVKQVQPAGGAFLLTYEGVDSSHDLGGGNYLFRTGQDREVEVKARVQPTTAYAAEEQARKEGVDYRALGFMEALEYQRRFASTYGHRSQVILFEVFRRQETRPIVVRFRDRIARAARELRAPGGRDLDIALLARNFCRAFFELDASFKNNHPQYPASGEGYYPDEIYFCPYDVDKKYYMTLGAGDMRVESGGAGART